MVRGKRALVVMPEIRLHNLVGGGLDVMARSDVSWQSTKFRGKI